jgi:hypothetical protein
MLMVILGAGASYDSDPRYPATGVNDSREADRIPLAAQLFWPGHGQFARQFPACQGLLSRLRSAAPKVESELERIRLEGQRKTFMQRQLEAIRYYLDALIQDREARWLDGIRDHLTTYVGLIQEIEEWREERGADVAFVTFNYDCLLDKACRSVIPELRLVSISDYRTAANHWVFKLHGSTDWRERVSFSKDLQWQGRGDLANFLIDQTGFVHPTGQISGPGDAFIPQQPTRPVIAIPMVSKTGDDFACPPEHLEKLKQIIPSVSDLVVIGWRGEEQHFHDLWRASATKRTQPRRLFVVDATTEAAEGIADRLRDAMGLSPGVVVEAAGEGFSRALETGVFRKLLQASQ